MRIRVLNSVARVLALVAVAALPVAMAAQTAVSGTGKDSSTGQPSRWDIFLGYSYLSPKGTVNTVQPNPQQTPVSASFDAVNIGGLFSGAYFFNRYAGVQVELGEHDWGTQCCNTNVGTRGNDDGFITLGGGPIFRYPAENFTAFAHALVNADRIGGPYYEPYKWGPGLTVGAECTRWVRENHPDQ